MQTSGIRFHPIDLSEYGKNPAGLPLFRVVWADSRMLKMAYEGDIVEMPRYDSAPLTHGKWILEQWLTPQKYTGLTAEKWHELYTTGPFAGYVTEEYPTEGEYELSHIFDGHVDAEGVRMAIEKTQYDLKNVSLAEMKAQREAREAAKQKDIKSAKADFISDTFDTPKEKVGVSYAI